MDFNGSLCFTIYNLIQFSLWKLGASERVHKIRAYTPSILTTAIANNTELQIFNFEIKKEQKYNFKFHSHKMATSNVTTYTTSVSFSLWTTDNRLRYRHLVNNQTDDFAQRFWEIYLNTNFAKYLK